MGGGLNEASVWAQVEAMATKLLPPGWTQIPYDYGWASNIAGADAYIDRYGRLYTRPGGGTRLGLAYSPPRNPP